jgi:lipopolysaccharide transport system permease protein
MVLSVFKNNRFKFSWYWELLAVLTQRNLKRRYRGSFLGVYWSLLNPLLMTVVYAAIFGQEFIKQEYYSSMKEYCLAAFTGLLVINFFSSSTAQALASIVENGTIVNKIKLPLSVFPLSTIGANIFQLSMGSFPLLLVVTLINSHNVINTFALLLPIFALVLVCSGVGMLMSSLYVFFRDLSYFYELVTFLLLFSSPIFYPKEIIPEVIQNNFLILNPLLPIIESIRQISLSATMPDLTLIFHSLVSGAIVITFGTIAFVILQPKFMDLL